MDLLELRTSVQVSEKTISIQYIVFTLKNIFLYNFNLFNGLYSLISFKIHFSLLQLCTYHIAFSVPSNIKKFCSLDVGEDILSSIHGLRMFSMLWVLFIHTYLLVFEGILKGISLAGKHIKVKYHYITSVLRLNYKKIFIWNQWIKFHQ